MSWFFLAASCFSVLLANMSCVVNGVDGYMCVHDHRVVVVCPGLSGYM